MELDERLGAVTRELERTGGAVELLDANWRLVWVSDELKEVLGEHDEEKLGYGEHFISRYASAPWRSVVSDESFSKAFDKNAGYAVATTQGDLETIRGHAGDDIATRLQDVRPRPAPPLWAFDFELTQEDAAAGRAWCYTVRLHDDDGEFFGILRLYTVGLPAHLLPIVARGDESLLERMARVRDVKPRAAAVLFADLDSSGVLGRRLAGEAYFRLVAAISGAVDACLVEHEGIVGKHAGDGATAFFLSEQLGSDAAAAKAAVESACALPRLAAEAVAQLDAEGFPIRPDECKMNIGVHWGPSLYIGQLATRGRLEVTALGEEVNECARIEQSARDGQVLASKAVIERLAPEDAQALGIEPAKLAYTSATDLPEADQKAKRDAGGIAIVNLRDVIAGSAGRRTTT